MVFFRSLAAALTALVCTPFAATAASSPRDPITVDARLSHRLLKEGASQKVYLRIGIKGAPGPSNETRTPLNIALVVDRSGSMRGDKMVKAREAAIMAVDRMGANDIASVVVFDHQVDVLQPAQPMTSHSAIRNQIARVDARGQTAIWAALHEAAREVRKNKSPGRLNRIILMSDGLANVGPSQPAEFERLGRDLAGEGISVTTIGLGDGYNEDLMSRLANASDGSHAFARTGSDLTRIFNHEFDEVLSVTAQDIEILIETRHGVRPLRSLGRESSIDANRARMRIAQAYGAAEYSLQLELDIPASAARGELDIAKVTVAYAVGGSGERRTSEITVRGRFTASESEVTASIDPVVMVPIIELESRDRTRKAVELRDQGKVDEARKVFEEDARKVEASSRIPGMLLSDPAKAKIEALKRASTEAAKEVTDEAKWVKQRKLQREGQSNSYAAPSASSPASVSGVLKY
jgi:Ca-activated chloride channel family protein